MNKLRLASLRRKKKRAEKKLEKTRREIRKLRLSLGPWHDLAKGFMDTPWG